MKIPKLENKEIEINTGSTEFSIGTYGWLDLDEHGSIVESEIEYLIGEGLIPENTDSDSDLLEIEYSYAEYLQALAAANCEYINELIHETGNKVISKVSLVEGSVYSPREYNFQTDSHIFMAEYNPLLLADFIGSHYAAYSQYVKDRWTSCSGFWSFIDENDLDTKVLFVLKDLSDSQSDGIYSHYMEMRERVSEWEYVSVSVKESV